MDLEDIQIKYQDIEKLKIATKIDGSLSVRLSFDRKNVTVILSDGIGSIELSKKQFITLQEFSFD